MHSSTRVKTWLYFWLGYCLCHRQRWKKICRGVIWYTCEIFVFNFHPVVPKSKFSFWLWVKQHPGVVILWEHNDPVGQLSKLLSPRPHHHWAFVRPLNILAQQVLDKGALAGQWIPVSLGDLFFFFSLCKVSVLLRSTGVWNTMIVTDTWTGKLVESWGELQCYCFSHIKFCPH